jgi:ABC-2 type transport system ATP-binding protein
LDLRVGRGELVALLGPNGAGKSTAVRILTTLARADSGQAWVTGFDVRREAREVRRRIGVVFQEPTLDRQLTVAENLRLHGLLYGLRRRRLAARTSDVLAALDLGSRRDDRVAVLSGGTARRLEIARALLHEPGVLFLDEPTVGLDPQARAGIWTDLTRLRAESGVSVLLTTHYLEEVDQANGVTILDRGRVVAQGTPAQLKARLGDEVIRLRTDRPEQVSANLGRAGYLTLPQDAAVDVWCVDAESALPAVITAAGAALHGAAVRPRTLDDVFLHHAGGRPA